MLEKPLPMWAICFNLTYSRSIAAIKQWMEGNKQKINLGKFILKFTYWKYETIKKMWEIFQNVDYEHIIEF